MKYKTYWLAGLLGPMLVSYAANVQAVEAKIYGGGWHTMFIHQGNVYGMGSNKRGELTTGAETEFRTPVFTGLNSAKSIAGKNYRTAVLHYNGKVTLTGAKGVLSTAGFVKGRWTLPNDPVVSDMAVTGTQIYYVSNNILYVWDYIATTGTVIPTTGTIKSIAAGDAHLLILFTDGTVGTLGRNNMGQLGNGTLVTSTSVVKLLVTNITDIAAQSDRSYLVVNNGNSVLAMGKNLGGELGIPDQLNRNVPTEIPGLTGVKKMIPSTMGAQAVMQTGELKGTGWHNYISVGTYLVNYSFVTLIPAGVLDGGSPGDHTVLDMGQSGTVHGWSGNLFGKLGDGTNTERHQVVPASFTMLPSSIPVVAPPVVVFTSMNECLKANSNVLGAGQLCKNLIIPANRGAGGDKKGG